MTKKRMIMISYFTQVTICWGLFYLLYAAWLRKETFFNTNRWYLLTTLVAGLAIPLFEFQLNTGATSTEILNPAYYLETITVTAQTIENNLEEIVITPVNESWSIQFILLSIYWLGVLFFASRFSYGMFQIFRLAYRGKITYKKNYFLVETDTVHLPFSFLDFLFWSKQVNFEEGDHEKILRHELCHINGKHSIDVLITELLSIFLWCSPFIFLYKSALKNIHEYLADDAVLKDTPTKKYGQLLLKQSKSGLQIAQANNFIHSQLKKRIIMMTKTKSQRHSLLKYIAILPLILVLVFSISAKNGLAGFTQKNAIQPIVTDTIPPSVTSTTESKGDIIYQVVEEMPRFYGCEDKPVTGRKNCADKKMLEYIYTNIKYPAAARKANIQGTIVASFIIEKDGSVSTPKILRKIGGGCDEEVLRIVNSMPDFIPGKQRGKNVRVQYNLPVKFKLEGPGKSSADNNFAIDLMRKFPDGAPPLIMLDGKEVTDITGIKSTDIEKIDVLKGEAAVEQYGEKGKDGVIMITTIKSDINIIALGKASSSAASETEEETFIVVEQMPMFPGTSDQESSNKALLTFVYSNITYPAEAKKNGIEGVTVVSFIIKKDGTIKSPKIERSIGGGTDKEVLKVVKKMMSGLSERWTPGMQRGKAVNVKFNLPVRFKLDPNPENKDQELTGNLKLGEAPALNELSNFEKIDIYPNPTSGKINVHLFSNSDSPTTITIADVNGKRVFQRKYNGKEIKIADLEVRNAADGILMVSFEQDGKIITKEVLLQQ